MLLHKNLRIKKWLSKNKKSGFLLSFSLAFLKSTIPWDSCDIIHFFHSIHLHHHPTFNHLFLLQTVMIMQGDFYDCSVYASHTSHVTNRSKEPIIMVIIKCTKQSNMKVILVFRKPFHFPIKQQVALLTFFKQTGPTWMKYGKHFCSELVDAVAHREHKGRPTLSYFEFLIDLFLWWGLIRRLVMRAVGAFTWKLTLHFFPLKREYMLSAKICEMMVMRMTTRMYDFIY